MKNSKEILPPDVYAIDKEIDDLFGHGDATPVAYWSGIKYAKLTAMLRVDDPTDNTVSETLKMIYGAAKHRKEMARAIFRIIYSRVIEWGLYDSTPTDILRDCKVKLGRITREDISQMSADEKTTLLAEIAVLEDQARGISKAVINARTKDEPRGREVGLTDLAGVSSD